MKTIQFGAWVEIPSASRCGSRSNVRTKENMDAVPRTNKTTPESEAVCSRTFGMSSSFSSR